MRPADLDAFFEHQRGAASRHQAAFTGPDPHDRAAFDAHWARILADPSVTARTIEVGGLPAGHVAGFERDGVPEVTYWLGRDFQGRGLATRALTAFLALVPRRPLFARAAADNAPSLRVLEKCGFVAHARERGFAAARGEEIEELVLRRDA